MRNGAMDPLRIPVAPLDVLPQQLVATCAGGDWNVDELLALVRSTQPCRELPRKNFDDVLAMLSNGIAMSRGRSGAFLHHDRMKGLVRAGHGSRKAAITSGGTIPDTAQFNVVDSDARLSGTWTTQVFDRIIT